jgi:hypothetical protein
MQWRRDGWGSGDLAPQFSIIFDLESRWRWVVSFTPQPIYPQGKSFRYPLGRRHVFCIIHPWLNQRIRRKTDPSNSLVRIQRMNRVRNPTKKRKLGISVAYSTATYFSLWFVLRHRQITDYIASTGRVICERWLGKDLEWSVCGIIKMLPRSLPGGAVIKPENLQSGYAILWHKGAHTTLRVVQHCVLCNIACCATGWSCMVLIDLIVNGQTCVAQNNSAQHDWSCMGPLIAERPE